jgi:hypothetical protein
MMNRWYGQCEESMDKRVVITEIDNNFRVDVDGIPEGDFHALQKFIFKAMRECRVGSIEKENDHGNTTE